MTEEEVLSLETAIEACVWQFYARARRDLLLGPIFDTHVFDWDVHLRVIMNFWSKVLLGTVRYSGHPYVHHVNLPIEPRHIDRWLELFTETAYATLPVHHAETALARARMMGESFKAGMFPFVGSDDKPSRHPA